MLLAKSASGTSARCWAGDSSWELLLGKKSTSPKPIRGSLAEKADGGTAAKERLWRRGLETELPSWERATGTVNKFQPIGFESRRHNEQGRPGDFCLSVPQKERLHNLQQQVQVEDFRWKWMLELAQKEVLLLLAHLGVRLEGVLPQRERTQVEQGQALRMLREELDEVSATAKRASVSFTQVQSHLDGLLEDISWHLPTWKNMEVSDQPNYARCSSYSIVNTEVLRKMFEHAMAPILEELKQRAQSEGICPSCQRLQKMMTQRGTE